MLCAAEGHSLCSARHCLKSARQRHFLASEVLGEITARSHVHLEINNRHPFEMLINLFNSADRVFRQFELTRNAQSWR